MAAITTPGALQYYAVTTVTFEDIARLDGEEFGFQAGQPYAKLGLKIKNAFVEAHANLANSSSGVAIRSAEIYKREENGREEHWNCLELLFSVPQTAIGFFYRDSLAKSVTLVAWDANGNVVEQETFPGGEGYAGLTRPNPDIAHLRVMALHDTANDAEQSRTYIDDLSFARTHKVVPKPPIEHGVVVVVVGGIRIDGGGIVIGPQGVTPVPPWNPEFQQVAAAANLLVQAEIISDIPLREEVKNSASLLLKESIARFFRSQ
jgi:hypothetical protein